MVTGVLVFLPLHVVAVRWMRGNYLLTTLNAVIIVSMMVAATVGWCFLGPHFSSPATAVVAIVGGVIAFAPYVGLYCTLGPTGVDRSVSAHVVSLLHLAPQHRLSRQKLFELYTHDDVLEKRIAECVETGIIEQDGDELIATKRGSRIAVFFLVLGKALGMRFWHLERHLAKR